MGRPMSWRRDNRNLGTAENGAGDGEYHSALFQKFVRGIERLEPRVELLDLGATTPDNLLYWLRRGHRVAAVDVLGKKVSRVAELGIGDRRFGGILCWNTLCALSREAAALRVAELRELLVPGGMLFAIFDGDGRTEPTPVRYRIVAEDRLRFEPLDRQLRLRAIATREIEALMEGLKPMRLTVMRHGSREALGQAPSQDP